MGKLIDSNGFYVGPPIFQGDLIPNKRVKSLGCLKAVRGNLSLHKQTELGDLGKLTVVEGHLDLAGCTNLKSLGLLNKVQHWANLDNCLNLKSLGNLAFVGTFLSLTNVPKLKSLGSLNCVGGLYLGDTELKDFGKLEKIANVSIKVGNRLPPDSPISNLSLNHVWAMGEPGDLSNVRTLASYLQVLEIFEQLPLTELPMWRYCQNGVFKTLVDRRLKS